MRMWSSAQALVNYGEAVGTMIVAGALADWSLNDAQRARLAAGAARAWQFVTDVRRRALADLLCRPQPLRNFLAVVFMFDALLVWHLARQMDYRGTSATARDILLADLLLFVMPLAVAAWALVRGGPRLVALLIGRGHLPACLARCIAAALATGLLGYGVLELMNATFLAVGPRADLAWSDPRLAIYAAEYALSGVIVSAMMIAGLLVALLGAAGLVLLFIAAVLMQGEFTARIIARYPRGALLGSSIAVAGIAIVINDWM
jgi:hypothetical protein